MKLEGDILPVSVFHIAVVFSGTIERTEGGLINNIIPLIIAIRILGVRPTKLLKVSRAELKEYTISNDIHRYSPILVTVMLHESCIETNVGVPYCAI